MAPLMDELKFGEEFGGGWVRKSLAHRYLGMSRSGFDSFYAVHLSELEVSRPSAKVVLISKRSLDSCLKRKSVSEISGGLFEHGGSDD